MAAGIGSVKVGGSSKPGNEVKKTLIVENEAMMGNLSEIYNNVL